MQSLISCWHKTALFQISYTCLLVLILGSNLSGCSGTQTETGQLVVAGTDSPDTNLRKFLEDLVQSARAMPNSGLMRGRLAMAYEANGFQDEAIVSYEQAAALDPNDFRWPYLSAHLKARRELHQAALNDLARALEIDANYAPAWLWRGTWLLDMNRPDEASSAFEKALALGADSESTFGRARVLMVKRQYDKALPLLEPLARDSAHPYIYRTLGYALRAVGRVDEARAALARGRNAQPIAWQDPRAAEKASFVRGIGRQSFAENLLAAGRLNEALEILQTMRREQPDETCEHIQRTCAVLNSLSLAYSRYGREDKAFTLVERGLSINAEFYPFHINIAGHYRQRRELDTALHHIDLAIALNPSLGEVHVQRGRLLIGLGKHADATTALETAMQLEPERPLTLLYLGMAEGQLKRWPQAIEHLERAIRLDPQFALGYAYLARSLGEIGNIDEAWKVLQKAEQNGAPDYELRTNKLRLKQLEAER